METQSIISHYSKTRKVQYLHPDYHGKQQNERMSKLSKVKNQVRTNKLPLITNTTNESENSIVNMLNETLAKKYFNSNSTRNPSKTLFLNKQHDKQDIGPLISFYQAKSQNSLNETKDKSENLRKFHLNSNLNFDETKVISNFLKNEEQNNKKHSFNKIRCMASEELFDNPYSSLKTLKINKQVFQSVNEILINKQLNDYSDFLTKQEDNTNKLKKVKKVKVSISSNKVNKDKNDNIFTKSTKAFKDQNQNKKEERDQELTRLKSKRFQSFSIFSNLLQPKLKMYGDLICHAKNKPKSRTQFTLAFGNERFYLFCGLNSTGLDDLWESRMTYHGPVWTQLFPKTKFHMIPRYGHTTVFFSNCLYTYGGTLFDEINLNRDEKDHVIIYDITNNQYNHELCTNRKEIPRRRNHICEVVNNHMLIHGGIDENSKVLNDVWYLDLYLFKWSRIETKTNPPFLAYHASTLVLGLSKKLATYTNLFRFQDSTYSGSNSKYIKYEGIYMFGGFNSEFEPTNELRIIKIGKRPLEIFSVNQLGDIPSPRILCTLNFEESLNVLILYGGKNDQIERTFNDIYILDLDSFTWSEINLENEAPLERSGHCSVAYENKLFIFGGNNSENFVGSDFYLLYYHNNTDSTKTMHRRNANVNDII